MDLTAVPLAFANYLSIAGFIFLAVLVWLVPKDLILSGAKDKATWRDFRWWASALIVVQLWIYIVFS